LKERIEVGMMMASEVPTQSGIRTSSGTATALPPTPNTPASDGPSCQERHH
jgi:hypothetical protein